jgi:hypothetical protein
MVLEGGAFWRWLGHEGKTLLNDIHALIKEVEEQPLVPSTSEDTIRKTIYEPEREPSPGTVSAGTLTLDLPAFRTS